MAPVSLEDHASLVEELGPAAGEILQAAWHEATRSFPAAALDAVYLQGARALRSLGRGDDLVVTFLQHAPAVAREVGHDGVGDLVAAALRCASKTSGTVVAAVVQGAPVAARRMGERALFQGYLQLIESLVAQVPRGVRPLLGQLDVLLGQLTLGGLRRWAAWGAQAHRSDFEAQQRYFALASPESLAVLQQERKGTLFVDVQRRIGMYLRALWGRDFFLRPTAGDYEQREGLRPFIQDLLIHVPDAYDDEGTASGIDRYRAAAAHAAAHLVHTRQRLNAEGLSPLQRAAVALVEDARVEALAIADFPGLQQLWARLHTASAPDATSGAASDAASGAANGAANSHGLTAGQLLARGARALLDPAYEDPHPAVVELRAAFDQARKRLQDPALAWDLGVAFAGQVAALRLPFNSRTDTGLASYRDDNRYAWELDERVAGAGGAELLPWMGQQVRRQVNLMEFVNETEVETAGDDAQEIWVLGTELFPYEDEGVSYNAREGKPPRPEPHHYPEWDYQIQVERPQWVTVIEPRAPLGDPADIDVILQRHKAVAGRLKRLIESLQPQGVQRLRRLEDGDELDLNAAVAAQVQVRRGESPDPRVMMRNVRRERDLAVLVLLDLSESTADIVRGTDQSVLALAREASVLLADAMRRIGDPFAIHGFSSDGRHDVHYQRFKDFDAPYDDTARARLAAMGSGRSTRMGAALRHAASHLRHCPQSRRLVLVITDGEPADVDVRDPQYLRHDARKAVEALSREGITSFCLSLDPLADQYVARVFGPRHFRVLDRVDRLPEQLPALYLGLTGRA
jgi:Mg-chelatase subunit ChlD